MSDVHQGGPLHGLPIRRRACAGIGPFGGPVGPVIHNPVVIHLTDFDLDAMVEAIRKDDDARRLCGYAPDPERCPPVEVASFDEARTLPIVSWQPAPVMRTGARTLLATGALASLYIVGGLILRVLEVVGHAG